MTKLSIALFSLALVLAALTAPRASASVDCEHSAAAGGDLNVYPYVDRRVDDLDFADATVRRDGDGLVVHSGFEPADCTGPDATLANTAAVRFHQNGLSFSILALSGGPLSGGPPETDGSHEVEVVFIARRSSLAYGEILGTPGVDVWSLGRRNGVAGASLSPARPEEFDVKLRRSRQADRLSGHRPWR
ncbi:MAG: hypothetical protein EXQ70_01780 [Solirubrobacterales bacterium]|nr:hypothetical protein [Solirubrobacterales bacterium]